jgi:phosphoribosyl 1,2-cyclic phosphate phosphodiesterase
VENQGRVILVDTTPELRLQSLAVGLDRVDAVLITHTHADHIFGLDDLRRFNDLTGQEIPLYGDAGTLDDIRRIFRYIFTETQLGGGKPRITLHEVPGAFELFGLTIESFSVFHGRLPVLAYRFNDFAYVTDVNFIPQESLDKLQNLDLLILDAVRPDPHETHFGLYQAVDVVRALKPKHALFTHISHRLGHESTNRDLPPEMGLAYDGQVIYL